MLRPRRSQQARHPLPGRLLGLALLIGCLGALAWLATGATHGAARPPLAAATTSQTHAPLTAPNASPTPAALATPLATPTGLLAVTPPSAVPSISPPFITSPSNTPPPTTPTPATAPTTTVPVAPTDTPRAYAAITRLLIPSIGVDAAVEVRSLDTDGVMQSPSAPDVVSWYDFSSHPVDGGNAVFAGHLDYVNYGPAVFWRLNELQPGDLIEVDEQDGTIVQYRVTAVRPFSATDDASAVVASAGHPTITLITCDGTFDRTDREYAERLVVTGDRVN